MAAMDLEDDEDIWATTISSPSASPPRLAARGFISTQLSLSSDLQLQLLSSAGGAQSSDARGAGFCIADAGGVRGAVDEQMSLGSAAAWSGGGGGADRRKKRMIKNRESAARSRARKQARVRHLELEVQNLQQENDMLKAQYEKLRATVEVPVPVRKTLHRTPSAPF